MSHKRNPILQTIQFLASDGICGWETDPTVRQIVIGLDRAQEAREFRSLHQEAIVQGGGIAVRGSNL